MSDGMSDYMSEKLSEQLLEYISYFMSWWDQLKQSNLAYYPLLCFLGHRHFLSHHPSCAACACCGQVALVGRVWGRFIWVYHGGTPQVIIYSKATNHLWMYITYGQTHMCQVVVPGSDLAPGRRPGDKPAAGTSSNRSATPGGLAIGHQDAKDVE